MLNVGNVGGLWKVHRVLPFCRKLFFDRTGEGSPGKKALVVGSGAMFRRSSIKFTQAKVIKVKKEKEKEKEEK